MEQANEIRQESGMDTEAPERKGRAGRAFRDYFSRLFDIRSGMVDCGRLHEMMEENTQIHGSNMWILIMAIFIASIGLNVNSTAVIIGAMLVSPLMSGILTMGYSLATSDLTMLRKAFTRFGTQVVISLIASTVYFCLTPLKVATSEMIARTSPTLWDVLIAMFGGIAGAIGNTRQEKGNVIPGVAIATALMPPLCTTGYGLATMQPKFIFGAFYLFTINTLFIMLSTAFVTRLMGIPVQRAGTPRRQRRIRRMVTVITVLTVIPSVLIGGLKVFETVKEQNFSDYLREEFTFSDTQVVKSELDLRERQVSVSLVGTQVPEDVIRRLEEAMPKYGLEGYTLHVTQNVFTQTEDSEAVTIALQEKTIQELQKLLAEQGEQLDSMRAALSSQVDCGQLAESAERIFVKLSGCACGILSDDSGEYAFLLCTAEEPLTQAEEQIIQNWLKTETGLPRAELSVTVLPQAEEDTALSGEAQAN